MVVALLVALAGAFVAALALGAVKRGQDYMALYPGKIGWIFLALTCGAVFLASAKMLQAVELQQMFGQE